MTWGKRLLKLCSDEVPVESDLEPGLNVPSYTPLEASSGILGTPTLSHHQVLAKTCNQNFHLHARVDLVSELYAIRSWKQALVAMLLDHWKPRGISSLVTASNPHDRLGKFQ
jgi:hypothetical protein